jgi:hypothetical protein
VFLGDPTGFDLFIDLRHRSALDFLLGVDTFRDGRGGYGHLTYLVTPVVGRGDAVWVPLRIGIGGALYGDRNDLNVAVRAPLELALHFRRTPLEIYGEIALELTFIDQNNNNDTVDIQGGIGLRFFL